MPKHEIYNFLKENGLTQKDEASFVKEYSDPKKAAELHKFFTDNGLTQKDSAAFYDNYFNPSKKKDTQYSSVSPTAAKPSVPTFGAVKASVMPSKKMMEEQPNVPSPDVAPKIDPASVQLYGQQIRSEAERKVNAPAMPVRLPSELMKEQRSDVLVGDNTAAPILLPKGVEPPQRKTFEMRSQQEMKAAGL